MSFTPFAEFHHRIQLQAPAVVAGLMLYWPPCLPWIASLTLCRQAFSVCFWTLSLWIYFWRNQIKTSTCLQRAQSLLGKMRLGKNRRGEWREGEERVGRGKDRLCGKCYHVGQRYYANKYDVFFLCLWYHVPRQAYMIHSSNKDLLHAYYMSGNNTRTNKKIPAYILVCVCVYIYMYIYIYNHS